MIFTTLGRYLFTRYLLVTFYFLFGTGAIAFLVDFSETMRRFSGLQFFTVRGALWMSTAHLPFILQQTVPFIALFVAMTMLVALNRRYELVVIRAAGVSVWQFLSPLIIGAAVFGVFGMLVLNPIAAWGQRKAQELEGEWQGGAPQTQVSPWLRQLTAKDDVIIGANTVIDGGMKLLNAVFIHFDAQDHIVLRQDAESATLERGYWQLNNVRETKPGEIPVSQPSARVATNLQKEFIAERLTVPETIAFYDLSNKIDVARSFGLSTKALETQFHALLSLPFLLSAMTMIAGTVSLKFSRFAQSRTLILGGIISGFVLYVVTVLVKAFGSSGVVPPFVAAWVPVVVALALGSTILLHQEDG